MNSPNSVCKTHNSFNNHISQTHTKYNPFISVHFHREFIFHCAHPNCFQRSMLFHMQTQRTAINIQRNHQWPSHAIWSDIRSPLSFHSNSMHSPFACSILSCRTLSRSLFLSVSVSLAASVGCLHIWMLTILMQTRAQDVALFLYLNAR